MNSAFGNGFGGSDVDDIVDLVLVDEPADGLHEISGVNPGDVLAPVARLSAQADAYQGEQGVENTAALKTHYHRGAHFDLGRASNRGIVQFPLPRLGNVQAEAPTVGEVRFAAADDAAGFVEAVRVNGSGARLRPDARWAPGRGHSFTDETGGHDAGLHDLPTIAGVVSAVDAAPGKLDDRIRAIKLCAPGAVRGCILLEGLPGRLQRAAADRDDFLPRTIKHARQNGPRLPASAQDDHLHTLFPYVMQDFSVPCGPASTSPRRAVGGSSSRGRPGRLQRRPAVSGRPARPRASCRF